MTRFNWYPTRDILIVSHFCCHCDICPNRVTIISNSPVFNQAGGVAIIRAGIFTSSTPLAQTVFHIFCRKNICIIIDTSNHSWTSRRVIFRYWYRCIYDSYILCICNGYVGNIINILCEIFTIGRNFESFEYRIIFRCHLINSQTFIAVIITVQPIQTSFSSNKIGIFRIIMKP